MSTTFLPSIAGCTGRTSDRPKPVAVTLLPVVGIVFVAFLVTGLAMPVLPLEVHQGLGFGMFVVGLVSGAQFAASLLSRFLAGHQADARGAKFALVVGLVMAAAAGGFYLLSVGCTHEPALSVALLLVGRAILGAGESFIVAGAFVWGLVRAGAEHTGAVMAWVGTPMYIAFAIGAPTGNALFDRFGFCAIALATMFIPMAALLLTGRIQHVPPRRHAAAPISKVLRAIWAPGLGSALSSIGFGSITTFIALLFAEHAWGSSWLAFTSMSAAFALSRLLLGHLPDRLGGARVALVFIVIEATGSGLIWLQYGAAVVLVGAALVGFGYALVYPAYGVEAIRRAPPESRGLASGTYTACLDIALGLGNPALGMVAGNAGVGSVYLVSTIVVMTSAIIASALLLQRKGLQNGERLS